jgi:hypothetical protein
MWRRASVVQGKSIMVYGVRSRSAHWTGAVWCCRLFMSGHLSRPSLPPSLVLQPWFQLRCPVYASRGVESSQITPLPQRLTESVTHPTPYSTRTLPQHPILGPPSCTPSNASPPFSFVGCHAAACAHFADFAGGPRRNSVTVCLYRYRVGMWWSHFGWLHPCGLTCAVCSDSAAYVYGALPKRR